MTLEELAEAARAEVVQGAAAPVRVLAMALEPTPDALAWAGEQEAQALLVHRWWDAGELPDGLGVIGLHDGLDDRVVPWLAAALCVRPAMPIARKTLAGPAPAGAAERCRELLGGQEELRPGRDGWSEGPVAVAGAMDDEIVRAAAEAAATLLVTGQWRVPGAEAVEETGMAVLVCGHERQERWAVGELARRLRGDLPGLELVVHPG